MFISDYLILLLYQILTYIVYCATKEKNIYFASVNFDSRAKRG